MREVPATSQSFEHPQLGAAIRHAHEPRSDERIAGSRFAGRRVEPPVIDPAPAKTDPHPPESILPSVDPDLVLRAYRTGVFPMADPDTGAIRWYSTDPRGILPLDAFHVPRTVRGAMKKFTVTSDRDFEGVIDGCADRSNSWISPEIRTAYVALHRSGHAHSIEAWKGPELAGGLYGVHIGAAFFAESMFHRVTDAGKVALVRFVEHLARLRFALCDIQMVTRITARFGAIHIPQDEYLERLADAVRRSAAWKAI